MRKIKILFICHGNICRSPMAESLMTHLVRQKRLEDRFLIASAATSREEIGNSIHPGTLDKLRRAGVEPVPHRAVQMRREDYDRYDLLLGMDGWNLRNMLAILGSDPQKKVRRLLDFTSSPRDIADPWYTGDFEATYQDILEGCTALLEACLAGEI